MISSVADTLLALLSPLIRRGYVEAPAPESTDLVFDGYCWRPLDSARGSVTAGVAFVLPTSWSRLTPESLEATVAATVSQVAEVSASGESGGLVVVLQCDVDEMPAAVGAATTLAHRARRGLIHVVVTTTRGKIAALNAAISLTSGRTRAVGWVDDDVALDSSCLVNMVRRLLDEPQPCAVGAKKVPHTSLHRTSSVIARAKRRMPSAMNHPHGCALVVSRSVVAAGIPTRYASDDGWLCFQLLDPDSSDPLRRLAIEPAAGVHYSVAGDLPSTLRRLRRQRLGQLLLAVDAAPALRRAYLETCFLHGVSLVPTESGATVVQRLELALYSWVHLTSTTLLVIEMALRGGLRMPLHEVRWGSPPTLSDLPVLTRAAVKAR